MDLTRLIVAVAASIPAGYLVGLFFDRIPERKPLLADLPGLRFTGYYLAGHLGVLGAFLGAAHRFGQDPWLELLPVAVFVTSSIALSLIDVDCYRLPDRLTIPTFVVVLALLSVIRVVGKDAKSIQVALFGAAFYFGVLFVFHLIFGNRGLGFGDVKLAATLGLMIGSLPSVDMRMTVTLVVYAMFIGFASSVVLGLALWVARGKSAGYPLGPFLVFGTYVAMFFSKPLLFG